MAADGRIYIFNREGTTHVIKPGTTYQKLADNAVSAQIMATPAAVDAVIYLRTDKGMMALGTR
jgi:outer membrane protein assembly factor BamB